jgi:hypothetical protein
MDYQVKGYSKELVHTVVPKPLQWKIRQVLTVRDVRREFW